MLKILVVEDDVFLVDVYKLKFESKSYEVRIALDGNQAIKSLASFTPDVILLDLLMPIKDGFETLKELKANPKWKNIPVIVTTNLSQSSDEERAMKLGAIDYLVKSNTTLEAIVSKVNSYSQVEKD